MALIGDSHAGHWRPAVGSFARAAGLRALSITRSSCPFSAGTPDLPPRRRASCLRWRRHVLRWLGGHPEVSTVFVSAHTGARLILPRGTPQAPAKAAAYARVWRALPASVARIVVLRDVPRSSKATLACVTRAITRRVAAGSACAVPRQFALREDAAVTAAWRAPGQRVQVLDLSRYFCGPRLCPPVIGGALVHKDTGHMTADYSESLGPSLAREIAALRPALAFPAPAVPRLAFSGTVGADARAVRYAVRLRLADAWRLTFRSSDGDGAQVTAVDTRPCGYRIALTLRGGVAAAPTERLRTLVPPEAQPDAAGQAVGDGGTRSAWVTWRGAPSGLLGGVFVVPVHRAGAARHSALVAAVTATPTSVPCADVDAGREAEELRRLLATLRLSTIR